MPEEILNPLMALGILLLIAGVVALLGYLSMKYHALRGRGPTSASIGSGVVRADTRQERLSERGQIPTQADASAIPLALRQWLDRVNHQPDRHPHLAVIGGSGAGKSTLVLAAMQDRPGEFMICTPKNERDDPWGGFPAVRLRKHDMSFEPIGEAVSAVYTEMLRRNAQSFDQDDWITLVIDDYSTVIGKLPDLKGKVLDIVTLGRSVRIRVVLLATEANVEAWGWKGRGEARNNVLFIACEVDEQHETRKAAMYRWGKESTAVPLDIREIGRLAQREWHARVWTPAEVSSLSGDERLPLPARRPATPARAVLVAADLGEELDDDPEQQSSRALWSHAGPDGFPEQAEHSQSAMSAMQSTVAPRDREGLIRFLVQQGWSANDIVKVLKGDSNKLYPLIEQIKQEEIA